MCHRGRSGRLRRVKEHWDPLDLFRHALSARPAGGRRRGPRSVRRHDPRTARRAPSRRRVPDQSPRGS
ncbi:MULTISPECIES: BBE domain-containing protein [unclassified Streptomyces]|uniref:BBE domain-containing protein n=1 Tax=unclassified Streptomyces TaxID=2593676 RepID=UPI00381479C4